MKYQNIHIFNLQLYTLTLPFDWALHSYCECFNAGLYCTSLCGCQDCLNRPEYEYTVKTSKQQIEYRYLIAFIAKDSTACH